MVEQRSDFVAFAWERVVGLLVSPGLGIVVYSPIALLAPWTLARFARHHRAEAATIVALFLATLVFYAHYQRWTGFWSAPGPRYLFVPTVFLLLPLAPWLDAARGLGARVAMITLCLAGLAVELVSATTEWSRIVIEQGYQQWQPEFGFVFEMAQAPALAAARAALDPAWSGLWIVRLAHGWPGQPPAPGAAIAIGVLWLAAVAAAVRWLAQALRETREENLESVG